MNTDLLNALLNEEPVSSAKEEAFKYKLELLKAEVDLVDKGIERDDSRAQTVKNFAIAVWATSITLFMGQESLRKFAIFTMILPILFWLLDGWWTSLRMGVHVRSQKIQEFVNSERLVLSFKERRLVDFDVLDPGGSQYRKDPTFIRYAKLSRIMKFKEMLLLYGGLTIFSAIIGIIAWLVF